MSFLSVEGPGLPSEQIHRQLRSRILAGTLAGGERLPSVRQLARDLGVASGTVAKAYKLLEEDGLVVSRAGAGTRVSGSVSSPPASVMKAARELTRVAAANGVQLDEAILALRASWPQE
ncbi:MULTISPECIES: GntR family transcriptional regulator [Cryobacterium]|uniref:GntR family transcriptional regulator n=1 Tax=Cryobacterium TaxID=69578 RepID=UPI00248D0F7A|nr:MULTISPECIES: GntR family transcriptional regulator [Cryobacterium]MDY7542917.1 GntR family transcriptional regulator [Cryobacterium sp. 5B3]MEA9999239.1 GntR family transcriptional regulator [Cryobacterium sp. RTS3]MEB0265376.1 GntR family transcriptional regulator [Cryobacterium sp. 10I5]MEB0274896.1 GntR family transcriptional regulator [Cryobacterium sp. 5B3]